MTVRAQSGATAEQVVRRLEPNGAKQSHRCGVIRELHHARTLRTRWHAAHSDQAVVQLRRLCRRQPVSETTLPRAIVDFHRNRAQPKHRLRRDVQNMIGQPNHVIALGDFLGGRVCIEDDAGAASVQLSTKKGLRKLTGTWIDVHDRPVTFNVRRYHMVEPHQGNMWCLAAYAPQSFKRATSDVVDALKQLDFPVPQ